MIAVIFEVTARDGAVDEYFAHAARLKSKLELIDGFVSVERFESVTQPGKFLSLSFWRDEEAVKRWRNQVDHRATQSASRATVFEDYRLRVANVIRDYGMFDRSEAPNDSQIHHSI